MLTDFQTTLIDMLWKTLSACALTWNKGLSTGLVRVVVVNLTCAFELEHFVYICPGDGLRLGCSVLNLSCENHHCKGPLQRMTETLFWPVSNLLVVGNTYVSWRDTSDTCHNVSIVHQN